MDTKKIETVLTTVTIDSKVDSGKIDVVVGESAKMDVVKAVNYIQSGKAEIEAGVTEVLNQVDDHVAEKTAEFDQNAQDKTDVFNSNAVDKTGDFNDNYTNKLNAFNQNASDKTDAFDLNAGNKTGDFNTNATNKTTDFNDNYVAKKALIDAEVQNAETAAETATAQAEIATDKASEALSSANAAESMATSASSSARSASNSASQAGVSASNASASELNAKASETAAAGSASSALSSANSASSSASSASSSASSASSSATNASNYADLSKQWAIGEPTEPSEGSAKYWAEQASQTLPNDGQLDIQVNGSSIATFTANQSGNTTANVVVPDSATWGNITGTLSNQTDLQTALNGKYDASNPNGYITGISSSDVTTALGYTPADQTHLVNGAPISNSSQYYYGTSSTAAATVQKEVTIAGITELNAGQVIVVKPTVTSTVANSTLKLNNFSAYPMRYNNANITTSTDSVVWSANYPTIWLFDGNYWVFAGHGIDSNTTYSVMSVAEGVAGTVTSSRVLRSDYLKEIIETLAPAEVIDQTYSATSTNAQSGTAVAEAISTKYDSSNPAGYITSSALAPYALSSSLSAVATSGAYADLSGKPNYGAGLSYSSSSLQLLDQNGNNLGSAVTIKSTPDLDGLTIDTNSSDELEAIGTVNKNTAVGATAVKYDWIGTLAEYNSQNVETLHPEWICYITDDVSGGTSVYTKTEVDNAISTALTAMLDSAFPVGYRYITEASTCPLATLIPNSTWVLTSQGRVIQGADSNHASGTTAEAGLPEIGGEFAIFATYGGGRVSGGFTQAFAGTTGSPNTVSKAGDMTVSFSAARSNSIYGASNTVQSPAEFVNIFKRIA